MSSGSPVAAYQSKAFEHRPGLVAVGRLAENGAVLDDDRVGGQDPLAVAGGGFGFLPGEPADEVAGAFAGVGRFVDRRRTDGEVEVEGREELATAGGGRGEDETAGSAHWKYPGRCWTLRPRLPRARGSFSFTSTLRKASRSPSGDSNTSTYWERTSVSIRS